MKRLALLAAASVLAFVAPASAATITYTLSGLFSGTRAGAGAFTDYAATFTGIGDTSLAFNQQDATFVPLSSLIATGTNGDTFDLGAGYNFWSSPSYAHAGFKTTVDAFAFEGAQLASYDNVSNLAPGSVSLYFSAPFATSQGEVFLTGASDLTLSASVSAVPEPATWAMMIGGFGMIGGTMRSRRRQSVRVTYG